VHRGRRCERAAWFRKIAIVERIGRGEPEPDKPKVVLGPGTGLGVAALFPVDGKWCAVGGEGGHVSLAASDEREAEIVSRIQKKYGHCSAERLISGPGLALLHELLHGTGVVSAEEVGNLATGGNPGAQESLELLFLFLGTIAANLALTLGAFGGVYIGGGIIPKHAERFASSGFRERFEAKGRYRDYLGSIPTYLITAKHPTLTGLAIRSSQPDY
jgi:glucokinase